MQEAVKILKNIPIESNLPLTSWLRSELLGLARFSGDVMLGEQIANKLIEQDSEKFWCHLLLVNIYAAAGRCDEVAQTKERMKKREGASETSKHHGILLIIPLFSLKLCPCLRVVQSRAHGMPLQENSTKMLTSWYSLFHLQMMSSSPKGASSMFSFC
ncbi:hypothetical protein MTR67_037115 [Solanum verrucosum]|uniref:Pentatricopeptide repeat-containing protein n=1 Tax=Solanum verrucosum TaxID=315347 RepID=A0AAF0ZNB0_SOLVR|nr:hypothetical protein MTR67_037115 [Solanum verrucosum]